ncbi:unnamed protein product [Prorocentrum cordatum]|uniref:Uncharacterized protein n=1 Tax=Prorocentrum cordatum TaxID=2364126 RepID=A0ABN9XNU6_9DINO|nr:unnamed protein product [Polarella glacialis]
MSWSDSKIFLRSAGRRFVVAGGKASNSALKSLKPTRPLPDLSSSWKRAVTKGSRILSLLRFMASSSSRSKSPCTMAVSTMSAVIRNAPRGSGARDLLHPQPLTQGPLWSRKLSVHIGGTRRRRTNDHDRIS